MKEVTLLTPELAYLLAIIGVKSAMGVDTTAVFPIDEAVKRSMYAKGYESLQRHNWMTRNEETGKYSLNIDVTRFVGTVANPNYVISTELHGKGSSTQRRLVHYITQKRIIEQTFLGENGYRLSDVDDISLAILRLCRAIKVPEKSRLGNHEVTLNEASFSKIKELVDTGKPKPALAGLKKMGMDEAAGKAAILSLAKPSTFGTLSVYALTGSRIDDLNVFAYFAGEGGGWATVKPDPKTDEVVLRTIDSATLWALIATCVGDLMSSKAEVAVDA